MAIPKARRRILANILALYRNNLRDNTDLDSVMLGKYIDAVQALKEKLADGEERSVIDEIFLERMKQSQLNLFQ